MRFPSARPRLDESIRSWLLTNRSDDRTWREIEKEIRARAISRSRRYRFIAEDGEDIAGESCLRLLSLLGSSAAGRIASFDHYIDRMIDNLCKGYVRRERPEWTRLKAEIVETLRGRRNAEGFSLWRSGRSELAGYKEWEGRDICWTARYAESQHDRGPLKRYISGLPERSAKGAPDVIAALFNWLGTPIPINELTTMTFDLMGLHEHERAISIDPEWTAPASPDVELDIIRSSLLKEIAAACLGLPRGDLGAFLLHLQPEVAERLLIWMTGKQDAAVALDTVASRLEISRSDLERALERSPWKDLQIAAFLQIRERSDHATQQRIINLRQRALRGIRRHIEAAGLCEQQAV